MAGSSRAPVRESSPAWPLAAAGLTVALWHVPHGKQVLLPFSLLADWFHEMGHGVAAMLLGGKFQKLLLYSDGAGQAISGGALWGGRLGWALVAASGPLGAPAAGYALMRVSRRPGPARACLWAIGGLLALSAALWGRTLFGFAYMALMGAAVLYAAWTPSGRVHAFTAQFLGVQACASVFKELDYVFSDYARVNGVRSASDAANVANLMGGPRWFWSAVLGAAALLFLGLSVRAACRRRPRSDLAAQKVWPKTR